jgi:hypothetical protein
MSPDAPEDKIADNAQARSATRPSSIVSIVLLGLTLLAVAAFAYLS